MVGEVMQGCVRQRRLTEISIQNFVARTKMELHKCRDGRKVGIFVILGLSKINWPSSAQDIGGPVDGRDLVEDDNVVDRAVVSRVLRGKDSSGPVDVIVRDLRRVGDDDVLPA